MGNRGFNLWVVTILVFLVMPFVAANGLKIVNYDNIVLQVNKTAGIDKSVNLVIKNEEPKTMHNITFEDNDIISIPEIASLSSGNSLNVTATVKGDADFEDIIRLRGFIENNLGASNETHEIDVEFDDGLSICDFTIIQGDTVIWHNLVNDEIRMKNEITGNEISTLLQGESYQTTFDSPEVLKYSFLRHGFRFTDICELTALSDSGFVNDPQLDALLSLDVNVDFEPTTIETTVLVRDYSIDVFGTDEGVISVKNTGSKVAHVKLSGDWFSYSKNNFDVDVGKTSVVTYTIKSIKPGVSSTNDTDKTYNPTINVSGNFDEKIENFSIFVNFANIGSGNSTTGRSLIDAFIEACAAKPSECGITPQVIYRDGANGTNGQVNITVQQDQFEQFAKLYFNDLDAREVDSNFIKEKIDEITGYFESINQRVTSLESENAELRQQTEDSSGNLQFLIVLGVICAIFLLLFLIGRHYKTSKGSVDLDTWGE